MADKRSNEKIPLIIKESQKEVSVHSIPCYIYTPNDSSGCINTDNIKERFESLISHTPCVSPCIQTSSDIIPTMTSSFRGRPLKGIKCELPNDYIGMTVKEKETTSDSTSSSSSSRQFCVRDTFSSLTCWSLDAPPSIDDGIMASVNKWIQISSCIHEPIPVQCNELSQ